MIDKLRYEDVLAISQALKKEADTINELASKRNFKEIVDFASTVEGYSKFLENTVNINKDADLAIASLKEQIK